MALTDISGIGQKTAEGLRERGIQTKDQLFQAFERGDPTVIDELNARALRGIRDALFEQGRQFTDPEMGVDVGPENRQAAEKIGLRTLGDLQSVDVTQAKSGNDAEISADTTLGELATPAAEGDLGERGAPDSVIGWAADAAANLGVADLSSGQIQDVNRIARESEGAQTTTPGRAKHNSPFPEYVEDRFTLDARETARAEAYHEDRSDRAQDVDEQREADVTADYSEWRSDPARHDYPGVDTPDPLSSFFAEYRKSNSFGLGSTTRQNRDEKQLRRSLETIQAADPQVQERAIGEEVDFDLDRLF